MNGQESDWLRGRSSGVRVGPRVVRRGDTLREATEPMRDVLQEAERKFLTLQSGSVVGDSTDVLSKYLAILADLEGVDDRLRETSGRRDVPYAVDRRLYSLGEHCRWLTRRVCEEFLLILQVRLEQEFRRVVDPHAYQMFLRLEEVADAAREIDALTDSQLMARLRERTLLREILEQVRLGDVLGGGRHVDTETERSLEDTPSM